MKGYSRKVFAVLLLLSFVIFYLVSGIAQARQYTKSTYTGPMGLPAKYHNITAEFSGNTGSMESNDLLGMLFQVLSRDDEAIAILHDMNSYNTYIYDPSGYYNTQDIKGGYFSREDFQSGTERGVLISKYSPYRLMNENGSIYCLGQYRNVVGEYDSQHPFFNTYSGGIIQCLAPGRILLNSTDTIDSMTVQVTLYIANCSEELCKEAEGAFGDAGWTITESLSMDETDNQDKGLMHTIFISYKDVVIMLLLMLLMGTVVLRRQAAVSCGGCSLSNVFIRGTIPVLIGSVAGCTIAVAVMTLIESKLIWISIPAAFVVSLVLGLLLLAASCMKARKGHASEGGIWLGRACSRVKSVCSPIGTVILICISICIAAYDMQVMPYFTRKVLMEKRLSHVQVVQFSAYMIEENETSQTLSLKQAVENAIKGGSAFSVVRGYNAPASFMVVGSKAFKRMYKLDWKEDIPAAYVKKSNQYLKKGDILNVASGIRDKTVEVVRYLDKSFRLYLSEWGGDSIQQDALVLMDLGDFKEAGYDSIKLVQNIYFLDPDSRFLNEFAMKLDVAGMGDSMAMFGRGTGQIYKENLMYYVLILGLTMALGIMMFLFILAAVSTMAEKRHIEMKAALLYGGGYRSIWLKIFPLAAVITVSAGALLGIGDVYNFFEYRAVSDLFIFPQEVMKEVTKEFLGKVPVGVASGLVLAAVVTTVVAGEMGTVLNLLQKPASWGSRDSSQQF